MKPTVLVTGDVVLDCHLYGGVKTMATSFSEPGTEYCEQPGGAALTYRLLRAAAGASGSPKFDTHFAFKTGRLARSLPEHLRSYGVWTERAVRKGAARRVWRVERHFGYGPTQPPDVAAIFTPQPGISRQPDLTILDDGAILFRHEVARKAWPALTANTRGLYLLKMSAPLCRGDLWPALAPVMDRLIVIVGVEDLRREDLQIVPRLSWERCVENTLQAFLSDSTAQELRRARHVIVNFGSAGALWIQRGRNGQPSAHLTFDPVLMEGDYSRGFDGTTYGFQTCVASGVAYHLMAGLPFRDAHAMDDALQAGIVAGLTARRRLLELGHGPVDDPRPGLPEKAIGEVLASSPGGFVPLRIPDDVSRATAPPWTIVAQSELGNAPPSPLIGSALLTARFGQGTLSHVPALKLGDFFTVDRNEIESLRTLEDLIQSYEGTKIQKKPLCIGVFGRPGAGKSFAVKALAQAILGSQVPFLEFNLSQFKNPEELVGAFHRVRDAVLKGVTPVAFWDEFDSQHYKWLQYLLAPMQDGAFQEGQITHPIGKCVFVFAGGTSPTLQEFGVDAPPLEFTLLKGPDFISRLDGFLNVLGPDAQPGATGADITWPIRRALTIRSILRLRDDEPLEIDPGLLHALVAVPTYRHGVRSLEKIVKALARTGDHGRLQRSALPPDPTLGRETDVKEFQTLMEQRNAFKTSADIEALAAAIHKSFLNAAEQARLKAEITKRPSDIWKIHPAVKQAFEQLAEDKKASNRAAARRIPDHLALIDFRVVPQSAKRGSSWRKPLIAAIERHVERLAQAEHLGWCAERAANGWTYAKDRDEALKHHPLLVKWVDLIPSDQEKDRSFARAIPDLLQDAGYAAVPVAAPPVPPRRVKHRRKQPARY